VLQQFQRTPEAVGWGDRITGVVHVDDLVAAMILAAEGKPGEHIISAGDLTTREMFKILEKRAFQSLALPNSG